MAIETKKFFNNTIKEIYQQTGAILSLENRSERQLLINSLKIFESRVVYNWQQIVHPILNGPTGSPYQKYSGMRSKPWAEFDSLDTVYGGISGWTLTAEPWATAEGMPCLWDNVNNQPHSITGALYCLSNRIEALHIIQEDRVNETFDDTELKADIYCLENNMTTLYKDVYGCNYTLDCDGEKQKQWSIYTHLYQIFNQLVDGAPTLSIDSSCEDPYPNMSIYMPVSSLTYDIKIPAGEIEGCSGDSILDDFQAIYTYVGMDACDSVPYYGTSNELCYINNGEPLDLSIFRLDQAICNLNTSFTSVNPVNLQQAYDNGDDANTFPGEILITTPTAGLGGGGIHFSVPIRAGIIDDYLFNISDSYQSNFSGESCFRDLNLFTVGEHEVYRKAAKNNDLTLVNSQLADFEYPNVHFHKSILTLEPTAGIPNTRGFQAADYNGASTDKDTALWVSSGQLRNCSDNTTVYDCDGNLVGGDNLYFRHPNNGHIFKLNKCGGTIDRKKDDGSEKVVNTDYPAGSSVREENGDYVPDTTTFTNPDGHGVTVGWNTGDISSNNGSNSEATFTVSEITAANVGASFDIRTLGSASAGKIRWAHGQLGSSVQLASIETSNDSNSLKLQTVGNRSIGLWTDSSQRMHVDSNGRIGVGTTSPSSNALLDVYGNVQIGNGGGGAHLIYNATNLYFNNLANGIEAAIINGNFGIGTTSPNAQLDVNGDVIVGGNLTVNGTTTTINSTTLRVDDKNIELGTVDTPTDTTADGGGITLKGATDKEFKWLSSTGLWTSNVGLDIGGGVSVGNSTSTTAGTIRWSGTDLEAYKSGGWVSLTASSSSTSPAGSNGQLQYNNNGSFGATTGIEWNSSFDSGGLEFTQPKGIIFSDAAGDSTENYIKIKAPVNVGSNYVLILPNSTPSNGQVLTATNPSGANNSVTLNWSNQSSGGIASVSADTNPQLGGNLDANGNDIDMGTNVITDTAVGQWNTAYGWGDHSTAGYLTSVNLNGLTGTTGTVSKFAIVSSGSSRTITPANIDISIFNNDAGYLTSLGTAIVDADFSSNGIMKRTGNGSYTTITDNSSNWDTAYGWGDHSSAGYTSNAGTVTSITPGADSGTGTAITGSGSISIEGGTNVTTSVSGTTVTINATGGGSAPTFGSIAFDTNSGDEQSGRNIHSSGNLSVFNETRVHLFRSGGTDARIQFNVEKGYSVGDILLIQNRIEANVFIEAVATDTFNNSPTLQSKFKGYYPAVNIGGNNECQFGNITSSSLSTYKVIRLPGNSTIKLHCTDVTSSSATFEVHES